MTTRLAICGLVVGAVLAGACSTTPPRAKVADPDLTVDTTKDPTARYFFGTVVRINPASNEMLITQGAARPEDYGYTRCTWNRDTVILLTWWDPVSRSYAKRTGDLTDIRPLMPVQIKGRKQDGRFIIDVAKFVTDVPAEAMTRPAAASSK